MSLESDKQAVRDFLTTARQSIERAIASFENGDMDKAKLRIEQYNVALKQSYEKLSIVQDTTLVLEDAQASKDEVIVSPVL